MGAMKKKSKAIMNEKKAKDEIRDNSVKTAAEGETPPTAETGHPFPDEKKEVGKKLRSMKTYDPELGYINVPVKEE